MKTRTLPIVFFLLMVTAFFTSCGTYDETKRGVWQFVGTEIWWVAPTDGDPPFEQITEIPYGQTFTRASGGETVYTGNEGKITRTEKVNGTVTGSITFTWTSFPEYIDPGVEFNCTIESKGNAGNGIGVAVDGTNNWVQSFRNGAKTAKLTLAKPIDPTISSQKQFVLDLSSGGYYFIFYYYKYEWIPE